jgi:hypothetical protein
VHRIRETSANRFTKATQRTERPQVEEMIAAARVPVFLLDEHQVVRPNEIGTVEAIKSHASATGIRVQHVPLDGQFDAVAAASTKIGCSASSISNLETPSSGPVMTTSK